LRSLCMVASVCQSHILDQGRRSLKQRKRYKASAISASLQIATKQHNCRGENISGGIATGYGLDGPRIESRMRGDVTHSQTGPGAHPLSFTIGTGTFQ
jgi:hypothetical protein